MLNSSSLASEVYSALQQAANIDSNGVALDHPPASNNFNQLYASAYDDYAKQGIVAGAINTGGDPSSLASALQSPLPNTTSTRSVLANALATYWSEVAITNGAPAHGGVSVVNVENNASSKVGDFLSAINSSITDQRSEPFFLNFFNNIETVVKSIEWSVTELFSNGSTSTFTVYIS